jgi:hypothetical protein
VDIDTDIEYTAVNDVQVTNPDTSLGTGGATANVDTYVSACKCVYGSFECNNNAISSSNTLSVCIKSSSDDVTYGFNFVEFSPSRDQRGYECRFEQCSRGK